MHSVQFNYTHACTCILLLTMYTYFAPIQAAHTKLIMFMYNRYITAHNLCAICRINLHAQSA